MLLLYTQPSLGRYLGRVGRYATSMMKISFPECNAPPLQRQIKEAHLAGRDKHFKT